MVSSPLAMLLFATPLECNGCIDNLPARRAETYRSIRAPVVHIGAGDSSLNQLLSFDSRPAQETRKLLWMTVELSSFTSRVSVPLGSLLIPPRRGTPRPSGVRLHARLDRPSPWIGTLPRRIQAVRRSRQKSSPDRRRTLLRFGPSGRASALACATGSRARADLQAHILEAAALPDRKSQIAKPSSPSAERRPEA